MYQKPCVASVLLSLLVMAGCSDTDLDKAEITGSVLYDGQPIENGAIRFIPTGETKGPTSGARIVEGKYHVTNKGGVPLGEHQVTVKSYRMPANLTAQEKAEGIRDQVLPSKHHKNSTLIVTITDDKSTWVQDFDLEK